MNKIIDLQNDLTNEFTKKMESQIKIRNTVQEALQKEFQTQEIKLNKLDTEANTSSMLIKSLQDDSKLARTTLKDLSDGVQKGESERLTMAKKFNESLGETLLHVENTKKAQIQFNKALTDLNHWKSKAQD